MRFGLMLITQAPPRGEGIVERWREVLEVAVVAEESGFDGVFVPEHHMAEDGCLPSPFVGLAAIAARTCRIELGTAACVLPFHHPMRIAEDAAMVDVLSNGRMRLGCGLGNIDVGASLFGIARASQVERLEESIDVIRRAWAGETVVHESEHFTTSGRISPLPVAAELWLAGMSAPGVRRAARLGLPWLSDPLHNTAVVAGWARTYREHCLESGATPRVMMMRDGWVADGIDDARAVWWAHAHADLAPRLDTYFRTAPRAVAERDPVLASISSAEQMRFESYRDDRVIVGSPSDCIAQITDLDQAVGGIDYLVMRMRMPTGPGVDEEIACVRRFGRDVIPALR